MKVLRVENFKVRKARKGDPCADLWELCCRKADRTMEEFARGNGKVYDTEYPCGISWEEDGKTGDYSVSFDIVLDEDYLNDPLNPKHTYEIYDDPSSDSPFNKEENQAFCKSWFVPAMDKDTFFKLAGLLDMSYKQLAEESGYSYSTIQAVKSGNRPVSKRLEAFITQKLLMSKDDEAIETVVRVCREDK